MLYPALSPKTQIRVPQTPKKSKTGNPKSCFPTRSKPFPKPCCKHVSFISADPSLLHNNAYSGPNVKSLEIYMGGCQNAGPFLGALNIRCRITMGTQKGIIILTTTHILWAIFLELLLAGALATLLWSLRPRLPTHGHRREAP